MDGLWDGLEKFGVRPDRLLLEWCSAAEAVRWQSIMHAAEKKRQMVTPEELERTRDVLTKARVPRPRNPKPADENKPAEFMCIRCGHRWHSIFSVKKERTCPDCRSNSVRWLRQTRQNHNSTL
jgi:DNA-directed RNA polymerase subunit RPC12/RpoP